MKYATAAHNCFCACGREVVTPLHPTKWKLVFDGVSVSLDPSIGSWSLECKSHYWLERGRICWADKFSDAQIQAVRARDQRDEQRYFAPPVDPAPIETVKPLAPATRWEKFLNWWAAR
jgi:hypothetical protein